MDMNVFQDILLIKHMLMVQNIFTVFYHLSKKGRKRKFI